MKEKLNKIYHNLVFTKNTITAILILSISAVFLHANKFENNWTPLYKGVDYRTVIKNKGKIKIHQIKIDANNPAVKFFITPPSEDGWRTIATKPSTFLKRERAQVVISGAGSDYGYVSPEGTLKAVDALSIFDGKQYREAQEENAAFIVLNDGTKKIIKTQEFPLYENSISMAIGASPSAGVQGLLIDDGLDCVPENLPNDKITARAAIGISKDEKNIYLVVVEGRSDKESIFQELVSEGVSLKNLMTIMQDLKCHRAMNLIGGGFATLAVKNMLNRKPIVLNSLTDFQGERPQGSHIGIKASRIITQEQFKIFRDLQEECSFFDLLRKSEPALQEQFMDKRTLSNLNNEITPLSKLYERFGIAQYTEKPINFDPLFKAKGESFDKCFIKEQKYDFQCGNPKSYLEKLGININEHVIKLTDLQLVGKKEIGINKGGIYMDSNKVFYFVKKAYSVKNEIFGARIANLLLDKESVPIIKLLSDQPAMAASRMIRGFTMAQGFDGSKKVVGQADLDLVLDFIGLTDRHSRNMGFVELNAKTVKAARVDYDYSFIFEDKRGEENDPLSLSLLHTTLGKYPVREILPMLKKIVNIPDRRIVMEVFQGWVILSQAGNTCTLKDAFNLASKLIKRKAAFKKELLRIKKDEKQKAADKLKKQKA